MSEGSVTARSAHEPKRRSLRARLAGWMVLSTTLTVLLFACVVYALVRAEAGEGGVATGEDAREQVLVAMAVAGPVCLVLAALGSRLASRRALASVEAVIREAGAITAETLRQRLVVPLENDELRDLVVALNALLARLDDGFAALETYAAMASHELRTPLAVVTNELEVALRRPRTADEWGRTAQRSLDEVRRLGGLVESLLVLSRASTAPNVAGARFELGEQLDETLSSMEAALLPARAELLSLRGGDPVWIQGDADLLTIAVRELVSNAARYSPPGSTVRVRLRKEEGLAAIDVDDVGPGVDPEERAAIFAPFKRGRAGVASADPVRGFGLGLAIAQRCVATFGGTIAVGASPEGGARFSVLLRQSASPRPGHARR